MCGLCGAYGWVGLKEKQALAHLQTFSQLRGTDSTGVGVIFADKKKDSEVLTSVGGFETLVLDYPKKFDADWELTPVGIECVIGHHRKATYKSTHIQVEHAHPFNYSNIIGCHNGTVLEYDIKKMNTYDKDKIDSQVVLEAINEIGSIKDVVADLCGAWAFVWWDKKNRQLNMCRNDRRTLCIAYTEDERTLFWASEAWMLHTALKRTGIKYNGKVYTLRADKHFTFDTENYKVKIVDCQDAPGYKYVAPANNNTARAGFRANTPAAPVDSKYKGPKEGGKVVPLVKKNTKNEFEEAYAEGFQGQFLNKRRYLHLTKSGCSGCETPLVWGDRKKVRWLDTETPLCTKCQVTFQNELDANESRKKVH